MWSSLFSIRCHGGPWHWFLFSFFPLLLLTLHYFVVWREGLSPDLHSLFFFLSERKKLGLGRSLHRPIIHYSGQKESAKALLFFAFMAIFRWQHAQVITWKNWREKQNKTDMKEAVPSSHIVFSPQCTGFVIKQHALINSTTDRASICFRHMESYVLSKRRILTCVFSSWMYVLRNKISYKRLVTRW